MTESDPSVIVLGDGPTGLSCALLLSKNGVTCHVVGKDETPTHKAMLHNFLGVEEMAGPEFMETARRQVEATGAVLHEEAVERVEKDGDRFVVHTSGGKYEGDYVVLATGRDLANAEALGVATRGDVVKVDLDCRTNVEHVYAGGWLTRGAKIQTIISAGDGAVIALDILSRVKGKPFHDFDYLQAGTQQKEKVQEAGRKQVG